MRLLVATLLTALVVPLAACQPAEDEDGAWWEDPPFGTRWVGYDGVVVAVPDWWTTGETQCGAPVEDTVWFDSGEIYDCGDPAHPSEVREASNVAVREGPEFVVTIADEGDGDEAAIVESERALPDGVTTVPLEVDGWTPPWGAGPKVADALVDAIEAAGLEAAVEVLEPDPNGDVADLPRGALLEVEPALGTPIEEGGRVVVTVMGTSGP